MSEVLPRDILFRAGGRTLQHGTLVGRSASIARGGEEGIETVARADGVLCAQRLDRDGILRDVAANLARIEWRDTDGDGVLDMPGLLSEYACTPAWTYPEDFSQAAWTKQNVTVGATVTAPDGTNTAQKMTETAAVNVHHYYERATGALTADRQQLTRFYVRGGVGRDWARVLTLDKANTARSSWVDLVNRVAGTVNAGHKLKVRKLAGGLWCEVEVTWNSGTGATAPLVDVVIALADNSQATYTGDVNNGIYVWGLQHVVDRGVGQSHVANIAAAVNTRADEAITCQIPFGLEDLTVLFDHGRNVVDDLAGVSLNVAEARGIFDLGDAGVNHVWAYHDYGSTRRVVAGVRGATTDQSVNINTPAGERLRGIIQVKNLLTGGQVAGDFGGVGLGAFSNATEPITKWQNQRIRLGGIVNANARLCAPLFDLIVARGLHTYAEMIAIP